MFFIQNMRIVNAYELAAGNDPSDVSFDQGKKCASIQFNVLRKFAFEPFPIIEHR